MGPQETFEPLMERQLPDKNHHERCEEAGTNLGQLPAIAGQTRPRGLSIAISVKP